MNLAILSLKHSSLGNKQKNNNVILSPKQEGPFLKASSDVFEKSQNETSSKISFSANTRVDKLRSEITKLGGDYNFSEGVEALERKLEKLKSKVSLESDDSGVAWGEKTTGEDLIDFLMRNS